jgi:hypothetical protein
MRELQLDRRGLSYLRDALASGKELSHALLERVDAQRATVSTFLPGEVDETAVYDFKGGGILRPAGPPIPIRKGRGGYAVPVPDLDEVLADFIQSHLQSGETTFCVLEDALSSPDDYPDNHIVSVKTIGQSVFLVLTPTDSDRTVIQEALKDTASIAPPTVGALGRWGSGTALETADRHLGTDDMTRIAKATERFFVRAYDGEGFVLWSRGDSVIGVMSNQTDQR